MIGAFDRKNGDKIIKVFKINNWNDLITERERERERERENVKEKYLNGGRNIRIIINVKRSCDKFQATRVIFIEIKRELIKLSVNIWA